MFSTLRASTRPLRLSPLRPHDARRALGAADLAHEVRPLPSAAEWAAAKSRDELVILGRQRFALDFKGTLNVFDDAVWDVRHLHTRVNTAENARLYFTRY